VDLEGMGFNFERDLFGSLYHLGVF
jgi:hypothetical protein